MKLREVRVKIKNIGSRWWFFISMLLAAATFVIAVPEKRLAAAEYFVSILGKVLPILVIVFILMALVNYFVNIRTLTKYLGESAGIKGWLISIGAGIISHGPIYMWYPLLHDLKKKGMRSAYIAAFLYNRAVKLPALPLMVLYFGLKYVAVLMILMILVSVVQGLVVEKALKLKMKGGDKK